MSFRWFFVAETSTELADAPYCAVSCTKTCRFRVQNTLVDKPRQSILDTKIVNLATQDVVFWHPTWQKTKRRSYNTLYHNKLQKHKNTAHRERQREGRRRTASVSAILTLLILTLCKAEARQGNQHTKENRNTAAHHTRLYFCFMSVLSRRWRVSERVVLKGIEDCREIAFARVREQHHDALAGILRTFRNLSRCEGSRA